MQKLKETSGYETPQTVVLNQILDSSILDASFTLEPLDEETVIS